MKKLLSVCTLLSSVLMAEGEPTHIPVSQTEALDHGNFFGQSRTFYLHRTFSGSKTNSRSSLATGGYIGYTSPEFSNFSATVALYGTYGFDIHSDDANIAGSAVYDPSLYGVGFDNYVFIGQAYIHYNHDHTTVKAGRMRLDTPFLGADDARMLPNLFEAVTLSNKSIDDTIFLLGHVFRETVGTYASLFDGNPEDITSGYGKALADASSGHFLNMGTLALGDNDFNGNGSTDNATAGVSILSAEYMGFEGVTLHAWDYIGWDIMNTLYLEADYTLGLNTSSKVKFSAQYINQTEIGDALAAEIETNYYAAKMTGYYDDFSAYIAYSTAGNTNGVMGGNVITPWGGMPAYTVGMVTRHQFFANTDAWKVSAAYNFKEYGVKASAYYLSNDVGLGNILVPDNAWTATEVGWDIQYKVASVDGLSLRARANYPRDFKEGLNWDEYRFIVNYNF